MGKSLSHGSLIGGYVRHSSLCSFLPLNSPRIKDVLSNLSQTVSEKRPSELLHSMAASKDILFWTSRRQLLQNKRKIPVTNIAELVEFVLLPHNDDVTKPRALNTFLDGFAELGVNKGLVKNKQLLSDLIKKEN